MLSGSIPRRGDRAARAPAYEHPTRSTSTATASPFGQFSDECTVDDGRGTTAWSSSRRHPHDDRDGSQGLIRDVALAGRYVAWVRPRDGRRRLVVHDLEAGADVLRLTVRDLRARDFDELALQDDGTVAFSYGDRNGQRIAWATPGTPGRRVLDRG